MANDENLKKGKATQFRAGEEQARIAAQGGIASGKSRRERKALAEILRAALDEDSGGGLTRGEYLVAKALSNHAKGKLTFKDLKDLQDLLGESVQNVNVHQDRLAIEVSPEIAKMMKEDADNGGI